MTETFTTASIKLENLSKSFGEVLAVDQVNLEVEAGTLVCLLGPSGCGKTTTLRMIGGFEEPTGGTIFIGDEDVTSIPPYSRPTALVFQSYALFPHMSVYDNIAYGLKARKTPKDEISTRVEDAIALMELEGQEKKSPPQLSGGQQQRVALARALVVRPKVLLFDEPLSNLDAQLRVRMRGEIRSVQRRLGITSVYVTHDQEEAFSIADSVAIMNEGQLVQLGTPRELYRRPADPFVAEFVGLSNLVHAEVVESDGQGAVIEIYGQRIRSRKAPESGKKQTTLVLRPEALELGPEDSTGVSGRIVTMSFIGPLIRYTVAVDGSSDVLMVDVHDPGPDDFYSEGVPIRVQLPEQVPALLE